MEKVENTNNREKQKIIQKFNLNRHYQKLKS